MNPLPTCAYTCFASMGMILGIDWFDGGRASVASWEWIGLAAGVVAVIATHIVERRHQLCRLAAVLR